MKRYNPEYVGESHDDSIDMEESDDGKWVRFEEALNLELAFKALEKRIEAFEK